MSEIFEVENYETQPNIEGVQDPQYSKVDKYADMFTATIITLGQLLLAAVLVAFGLSAVPVLHFSWGLVLRTFVFLLGLKFTFAAYKIKLL